MALARALVQQPDARPVRRADGQPRSGVGRDRDDAAPRPAPAPPDDPHRRDPQPRPGRAHGHAVQAGRRPAGRAVRRMTRLLLRNLLHYWRTNAGRGGGRRDGGGGAGRRPARGPVGPGEPARPAGRTHRRDRLRRFGRSLLPRRTGARLRAGRSGRRPARELPDHRRQRRPRPGGRRPPGLRRQRLRRRRAVLAVSRAAPRPRPSRTARRSSARRSPRISAPGPETACCSGSAAGGDIPGESLYGRRESAEQDDQADVQRRRGAGAARRVRAAARTRERCSPSSCR